MIKLLLVEDNLIMQQHFVSLFRENPEFNLVSAVRDAFDAEKLCQGHEVDVVLMDVQTLHNHSGLAAGKRIRNYFPGTKVVIITSLIDPNVLTKAKMGCADSLWYKDHGDEDIIDVIKRTFSGENIFPEMSPGVELKDMFSSDITPRQLEILRRFVMGMTYGEIADELKLTKNGVRWNLDQIVEKGGFQNKHEMLAAVIENKLIVTTLQEE